jgi:hypothetical protein
MHKELRSTNSIMESNFLQKTIIAGNKIINYCMGSNLYEPIDTITILVSYLSGSLSSLEEYLRGKGTQWENVKIVYKDVPAIVECNLCGAHFGARGEESMCTNCLFPAGFCNAVTKYPYHLRLKEIRLGSGELIKAKRNTILI